MGEEDEGDEVEGEAWRGSAVGFGALGDGGSALGMGPLASSRPVAMLPRGGNWRRRLLHSRPEGSEIGAGQCDSPIWFSTNRLASNRKAPSSFLRCRRTSTTLALFRLYSGPFMSTSSVVPFSRSTAAVASVGRGLPALPPPAAFWLGGSAMISRGEVGKPDEWAVLSLRGGGVFLSGRGSKEKRIARGK